MNDTHSKKQKDLLKSIKIKSEKDLISEFSSIYQALENINNDWDKRLEALKKIQILIQLPDIIQTDAFLTQYTKLIPCLNSQIKDLRSAITKEACNVICLSAEKLQDFFEPIAQKFISRESLLSVINSGNKIISENGHKCIQSIIENVPSEKYIQVVLEELHSKNKDVRHKVSNYCLQMIQTFDQSLIEHNINLFENALQKGLIDASQEVRNNSKEAFCLFNEYFPNNADRLFSTFDVQTKKAVTESLENFEQTGTISKGQYSKQQQQKQGLSQLQQQQQQQQLIGSPSSSQQQQQQQAQQRPASFVQNESNGNLNPANSNPGTANKKKRNSSSSFNEREQQQQQPQQQQPPQQQQSQKSNQQQLSSTLQDLLVKSKTTPQKQQQPPPTTSQQQQQQQQNNNQNQNTAFLKKPPKTTDSQQNQVITSQKQLDTKSLGLIPASPNTKEAVSGSSQIRGSGKNQIKQQQQQQGQQKQQQKQQQQQLTENYNNIDGDEEEVDDENNNDNDFNEQPYSNDQYLERRNQQQKQLMYSSLDQKKRKSQTLTQIEGVSTKSPISKQQSNPNKQQIENLQNLRTNSMEKQQQQNVQNSQKLGNVNSSQQIQSKKLIQANNAVSQSLQIKQNNKKEKSQNSDDFDDQQQQQYQQASCNDDAIINTIINKSSNSNSCYSGDNNNNSNNGVNNSKNALPPAQQQKQVQQQAPAASSSWRDDDIQFLLEKTKNPNWATRSSAFEQIGERIDELSQEKDQEELSQQCIQKIIEAHIDHLQDSHFKVVSACLDSFITLLGFKKEMVPPYMNKIIPKLLINLTDSKEKVSQQANFLLNLLQRLFKSDDMVTPTLKFLDGLTKQNLKISTLEVLTQIVKESTVFFNSVNNVKGLVQQLARLTVEHFNNKQVIMPCLGILLILKDKNPQMTFHSILTLPNQNEVASIRLLAVQHVPELEDQLRAFAINPAMISTSSTSSVNNLCKENIKPTTSLTRDNNNINNNQLQQQQLQQQQQQQQLQQQQQIQQQLLQQNLQQPFQVSSSQQQQTSATSSSSQQQLLIQSQNQSAKVQQQQQKREVFQSLSQINQNNHNSVAAGSANANNKSISICDNLFQVKNLVNNFEDNQEFIIQHINEILTNLTINFNKFPKEQQEMAQQTIYQLFQQKANFGTLQPEIIQLCLDLYYNALKEPSLYLIDEIIDQMILKVPHLTFMKALVDRMGKEKPPILQNIIKKIQQIIQTAQKEEIRPFLDHIIDNFKIAINDQSPDVRKSVVFCIVDLHSLFKPEIDSYLQLFTPTQQKLIDVYIKRKQEEEVTHDY